MTPDANADLKWANLVKKLITENRSLLPREAKVLLERVKELEGRCPFCGYALASPGFFLCQNSAHKEYRIGKEASR